MAKFTFDLIVNGATMQGLAVARAAIDYGMKVCVLEWTGHVGGLTTGGLGVGDWVSRTRWGYALRFFQYIATHPPYNLPEGSEQKDFNSNEAIAAMTAILLDRMDNLTIVTKARIRRVHWKPDEPAAQQYVELENGDTYWSDYWADGSYECDMPAIGGRIRMQYGRNSRSFFREKIQFPDNLGELSQPGFTLKTPANGRMVDDRGDRYHNATPPPFVGQVSGGGGPRSQAYGYRYTLIYDTPSLTIPWPRPPGWRDADIDRVVDLSNKGDSGSLFPFGMGTAPVSGTPDTSPASPGRYSCNGSDMAGIYTNGWGNKSFADREKTALRACYNIMGAHWTVANDPRISATKRAAMAKWGLPNDEFQTDYIGFPGHPSAYYVRDDRSIWAQYVMTTRDMYDDTGLNTAGYFPDPIAVGGYHADFHLFYRYGLPGNVQSQREGGMDYSGIRRYSIPLRACLPHPAQCNNMVVAWGIGGSSIFRASFRMEAQAMMTGQALGMLIGLAWSRKVKIGAVPYSDLLVKLNAANAILRYP